MMNKYAEMLSTKQASAQSDLILLALPDKAVMSRVVACQHGHSGPMVYSYEDKPFLEVYPPQIESIHEDGGYKIKVTTNYRILK